MRPHAHQILVAKGTMKTILGKIADIDLLDGVVPDPINHCTCDNPYEARFDDEWEEEIKKHTMLKGFVYVTDLIEHMWTETEEHYKYTDHKNT